MKLYLVRHGEAKTASQDPARPLSEAGLSAVRTVADFLKRNHAVTVTEIRHSTKLRARQTAQALAKSLLLKVPIKEVPHLEPEDDARTLAGSLGEEKGPLMLVGHLPHLNHLASLLVFGNEAAETFNFSECSVLCLRSVSEGGSPAKWVVDWMVTPDLVISS